ncbi:MAG: class III lanthipeptide [Terracoccus sp.]
MSFVLDLQKFATTTDETAVLSSVSNNCFNEEA